MIFDFMCAFQNMITIVTVLSIIVVLAKILEKNKEMNLIIQSEREQRFYYIFYIRMAQYNCFSLSIRFSFEVAVNCMICVMFPLCG